MRPSAHFVVPQPYAFMADIESSSTGAWYPDSGASHHLTYNPNNLAYRAPYNGQDQVLMGNGQGVPIQSLGHSNFISPHTPNVHLTLKDLLHVPHISKNLLSVSKFAQDNNVVFEFHPYHCLVKSQGSNQVLLEGTVGADGLYQFQPFKFLNPSGANSSSSTGPNIVSNTNKPVKCINNSAVHNSLVYSLPSQIDCNKAPSAVYSDFSSLHCTFPFPISCNNNSSVLSNDNEFQKWHLRLGHAHSNAVKSVL
jgi:hypothetical protein